MPEYNSNIRALNDVVVDYGLPGGHHFEIDALNAWAVHLGGSGGHQFNIDALNEIIGLVGGSGSFQFEIDAYNEISRALGGGSDFRFVEDALSEISDLPVFGGEAPEWVPEDFSEGIWIEPRVLDGFLTGRAWVFGVGEVAVDTLLGSDANVNGFWGGSGYDPAGLSADGYEYPIDPFSPPALIGAAKTKVLAGSTFVVQVKGLISGDFAAYFLALGASSGEYGLSWEMSPGGLALTGVALSGTYSVSIPDVGVEGSESLNRFAGTITPTRLEISLNGSTPDAKSVINEWPQSGEGVFNAVVVDSPRYLQFIGIRDALPDTTGLAALSETA